MKLSRVAIKSFGGFDFKYWLCICKAARSRGTKRSIRCFETHSVKDNERLTTYCSEVRNMIALATSSAAPTRFIGILFVALFLRASSSGSDIPADLYKFVSTKEGATQLTLMPKGASSIAEAWVSISTPALLMQYAIRPGSGRLPLSELTLITHPLEFRKNSRKKWVNTKGALRFTSIWRS